MDAPTNEPGRPRRRLFWLVAVALVLGFATVAYFLHRPRAASHVIVVEVVDDATGQTLTMRPAKLFRSRSSFRLRSRGLILGCQRSCRSLLAKFNFPGMTLRCTTFEWVPRRT